MERRDSFIFYRSFHEAVKDLPPETYKEILSAVIEYALDGVVSDLSSVGKCAFLLMKPQIDANIRRRENGRKGGRPRVEVTEAEPEDNLKITEPKPKDNLDQTEPKPNGKWIMVNGKCEMEKENEDSGKTAETVSADLADCESIPLHDGTEWRPTTGLLEEWERLYPAVDVKQAIREMRGWCLANPSNRKTRRGVQAFVTRWLSREQNKAPMRKKERRTRFDNFESHGTDYDALMWDAVGGGKR